jgi:hypothetical protein
MEAPQREDECSHQEHEGKNAPGQSIIFIATALTDGIGGSSGDGLEYWGIQGLDHGKDGGAGGHKIGNSLVFVQTEMVGVGAHETLVKDPAGKLIELVFLKGSQKTGTDLGGDSNIIQRNLSLQPFPF